MQLLKKYYFFFFVLLIIAGGYFSLRESFKLTLFGDDWLVFWRYLFHLGPPSSGEFNYLTYFLTVYGPEDMSLGIFQPLFGYHSIYYYSVSFLLRILAALSIYPLTYFLTKNKTSSLVASLFFAISYIGIETTNWVFNMPSYLAIITFSFFLILLCSRKYLNFKKGFLLGFLFYLTFIIQPIRMTGLPIMILLIEFFWLLEKPSFSTLKQIFIRFLIIFIAFLFVKFGGQSISTSGEMVQRVLTGLSFITNQINTGHTDVLMNPFILVGSLFIPDVLWTKISIFRAGSGMFLSLFLPFFFVYFVLVFLIYKVLPKSPYNKSFLLINGVFAFLWTLLVRFIDKQNPFTFGDPFKIGTALIGGYFFILLITLIKYFFRKPLSVPFFLSLIITLFSFLIPWFFSPGGYYSTFHRYLILTGIGIGLFWASIISLFKQSKYFVLIMLIVGAAFVLQIQANNFFFADLVASRGNSISDTIWTQLQKNFPDFNTAKHPLVFYFAGDSSNSSTINDVITFGFPPHIALLYNIYHDDDRIPIPVSEYKEIEDIVKTGKPMSKYGRKQKPLSIDQIYAFKLEGKTKIVNITSETRKKLKLLVQ